MNSKSVTPKLVILSAPSGAGKTTLCARLLNRYPGRLRLSISSTTRAPRAGEKNGVNYYFVSKADFEAGIREGQFAEWAEVHGNYYGTSRSFIDECFQKGLSVLLDIDVQGAASLRSSYPDHSVSVFVSPPSLEILEQRLRARATDTPEAIERRLRNARTEMQRIHEFEHVLVNDELEKAFQKLIEILDPILSLEQKDV